VLSLTLSLLLGGAAGAALGYFGKCSSGTCPLTANWRRGALFGALLGLMFHLMSGGGSSASNESSLNVKLIREDQFNAEVMQASMPVVVDFFATWCGPCKRLSPLLDELAGPLTNRVRFVKMDIDKSPGLTRRFDIQAVPTLVFFKKGEIVDRVLGLPPENELKERLESLAGTRVSAEAAR
jgi:thioredoxin